MYHSDIKIKEGAFVVSDAHYSSSRPELLNFFKAIEAKKLFPTQLILMGDIFDALFGEVPSTHEMNQEPIAIINKLTQEIEVVYLEGNHDFNLQEIFPNVRIISFAQQPLLCSFSDKKVILAHGDFDGPFLYQLYTGIVRNILVLKFLNLFDTYLLDKLDKYLAKKDDCKELEWFDEFIKKRIAKNYNVDYFIEGHFHQNKQIKLSKTTYINLAAFACNQRYFIVKSSKDKELLEENIFS